MTDIQLYHYFKEKSVDFNEMPSAEMWQKISTNITATQTQLPSKPFIPKLFLVVALLIMGILGIVMTKHSRERKKPTEHTIIQNSPDSTKVQTMKDTIPEKENCNIFKRRLAPKTPTVKGIPFKLNPKKMDTVKPKFTAFKPTGVDTIQRKIEPAMMPNSNAVNTIERIVISSNRKLSKSGFDSLVRQSLKINQAAVGKILIVKAPGHVPFRTRIASVKTADTIPSKQ